jgi:hypothetical protein
MKSDRMGRWDYGYGYGYVSVWVLYDYAGFWDDVVNVDRG